MISKRIGHCSKFWFIVCILLSIGVVTSLYVRSTFSTIGIENLHSSDDLKQNHVELTAVWGMENEDVVFRNLQETIGASLERIDKASEVLIIRPDDVFEQRSSFFFQRVTVVEVLRSAETTLEEGESIWLYRYGGFVNNKGRLAYEDTQNILSPSDEYLVFLSYSPLNEYVTEKEYGFVTTEFSCICLSSGKAQTVCQQYNLAGNEDNEDFCASDRILMLFQEVKSTILYRYRELSPRIATVERSVPPQPYLITLSRQNHIPQFNSKKVLTEREVLWFGNSYFNCNSGSNLVLQEEFTSPKKVNLGIVFCFGMTPFKEGAFQNTKLNAEEQRAIEALDPRATEIDIIKVTKADMDAVLKAHMGISASETEGIGLNSFLYLEEYQTYYSISGASNYREIPIMVDSGYRTDTGYIVLQYRKGLAANKYLQSCWEVVIQENNGKYLIYSNAEVKR